VAGLEALPRPGAPDALYAVDLYGSMWRYFRAPGQARWAARQFSELMKRVLRERRPAKVAVAADNSWPTWRHELYPEAARAGTGRPEGWKANRAPLPASEKAAFLEQVRYAEDALEDVFGIRRYAARGFDGDDVVASLVEAGLRARHRVVVLGHDKDFAQLVRCDSGCRVVVWDGRDEVLDSVAVRERFKVWPHQMVDYQAIVGDSSDNVPGVRGVGPKGAELVLDRFQTLDAALASAERGRDADPFWAANGKLWRCMAGGRAAAELCRRLVELRRDVPLGLSERLGELDAEGALP
jgi:DNA polymerase I